MSNLMGLMFSFLLMMPTILLGADLFRISQIMTSLEARATTLSYEISKSGGLRANNVAALEEEGITVSCNTDCEYISVGESISYTLMKSYTPIILKNEDIEIIVTRVTIVGYL